jgi:quercetin dioxygenase-like cupin family protein
LHDLALILRINVKRRVDHIPSPRRVWSSANAHATEAAMKRMAFMLSMTLAVGMTLGVLGNRLLNAGHAPVNVSELLKTDLAGNPGNEGSIFLADPAPGAAVGKHYHPGDAFAYILEGSMAIEVAGKPPVTLKPGDTGHVPPKQVHDDKNASQTAPLKFLVFQVAEKGQSLAFLAQ